jgi:hypothetical protein
MTALALHAWLDAGHRVTGFLCCEPPAWWREDRRLSWLRPLLSVSAALYRAGCAAQVAPPKARDAAILAAIDATRPDLLLDDAFAEAGGATLHLMDPTLDGGPIIARRALAPPFPADALGYRLASGMAAAALVAETVPEFLAGRRRATPQTTPAMLRRATEADLTVGPDWSRARIERLARALPWSHALLVADGLRNVVVAGPPRFLPADASPAPPGFVQTPCEGGVVRFRRRGGLDKRLWTMRRLLRHATAPLPPPGQERP